MAIEKGSVSTQQTGGGNTPEEQNAVIVQQMAQFFATYNLNISRQQYNLDFIYEQEATLDNLNQQIAKLQDPQLKSALTAQMVAITAIETATNAGITPNETDWIKGGGDSILYPPKEIKHYYDDDDDCTLGCISLGFIFGAPLGTAVYALASPYSLYKDVSEVFSELFAGQRVSANVKTLAASTVVTGLLATAAWAIAASTPVGWAALAIYALVAVSAWLVKGIRAYFNSKDADNATQSHLDTDSRFQLTKEEIIALTSNHYDEDDIVKIDKIIQGLAVKATQVHGPTGFFGTTDEHKAIVKTLMAVKRGDIPEQLKQAYEIGLPKAKSEVDSETSASHVDTDAHFQLTKEEITKFLSDGYKIDDIGKIDKIIQDLAIQAGSQGNATVFFSSTKNKEDVITTLMAVKRGDIPEQLRQKYKIEAPQAQSAADGEHSLEKELLERGMFAA